MHFYLQNPLDIRYGNTGFCATLFMYVYILSINLSIYQSINLSRALIEQCRNDNECDEEQFYCKRDAGEVCIKYSRFTK